MTRPGYAQLQDVILDPDFPELDLALRRGCHVDRDDVAWYALLGDAQDHLEAFYRRYGCELVHKSDGYFYLLPTGDKLSRLQLATGDMLVGQALALLYLHPSTIERGGLHTAEELIAQLAAVMGTDALIRAFNPKRRRYDERVAQKNVRSRVSEAVRRLAGLGFVEMLEGEQLRLRPALLRFAEPVRGLSEPAEALAQLVARGEIALEDEGGAGAVAADDDGETEADPEDDDDATDDTEHGEAAPPVHGEDADAVVRRVVHGDETAPAKPGAVVRRVARDDEDVASSTSEPGAARSGPVVPRIARDDEDAAPSTSEPGAAKPGPVVPRIARGDDDDGSEDHRARASATSGAASPAPDGGVLRRLDRDDDDGDGDAT